MRFDLDGIDLPQSVSYAAIADATPVEEPVVGEKPPIPERDEGPGRCENADILCLVLFFMMTIVLVLVCVFA